MTTHHHRRALGDAGEELACDYLRRRGWTILDRNWRCRAGELDIVAAEGTRLVAVEVKTRASTRFGTPLEAITPAKSSRLHRLVLLWAASHRHRHSGVRVDVVAVLMPPGGPARVEHVRGVA